MNNITDGTTEGTPRRADNATRRRTLTTADLAASANRPESATAPNASPPIDTPATGARPTDAAPNDAAPTDPRAAVDADAGASQDRPAAEELAPLFDERLAQDFRARWSIVQQGFVDDPERSVRQGDELVAQVIKSLAETFAQQRASLEDAPGSTEDLRLALRRYRSFFERLLAI